MDNIIEGKNAVIEALCSGRQIDNILLAGNDGKIIALAKEKRIAVKNVPKKKLDEISETRKHQGVIAFAAIKEYAQTEDILEYAKAKKEPPFIVILDHINDPHNLGAIIRTAEAAGAHGVIIPGRRAAAITPVVEKAAAGAVSHMLIARVANIPSTIEGLKKQGVWVYCATQCAKPLFDESISGAVAIVIGSEGGGVSELVRKKCDFEVSIPMYGSISSLNASVAAGIILYEVVRQRISTLK